MSHCHDPMPERTSIVICKRSLYPIKHVGTTKGSDERGGEWHWICLGGSGTFHISKELIDPLLQERTVEFHHRLEEDDY